ncbi:Piso0_001679 [Millerozyma farinosa CBS 7064]|uniref:Piso0_001679 protein n=1 Tax=Pichia sorbitophila (strain ATCC MYA-4447 / BCRC 22081 / CBS 7064 / NBRC 10061 / NRRL Y-12695) TaxID=559304 RepID=G8YNT4_PICSO|nr:Piso0_001679 [Millerozyma farinosa CBS 7064]
MAKSLRSKSKLKAKSVKRKVFSTLVDDREKRLASKMEEKLRQESKAREAAGGETPVDSATAEMETDEKQPEKKKISTSGWRDSRKQQYKKRKKNKHLHH